MGPKIDIEKIDYIKVLGNNRRALVYTSDDGRYYINVNTNTPEGGYNRKYYSKDNVEYVGKFYDILKFNNLWILLIDSYGELQSKISKSVAIGIFEKYATMELLNPAISREINYIATLVVDKYINKLLDIEHKLSKEQQIDFRKLLRSYIYIDIAINGLTERKLIISKDNECIDYKILRLLKYLGIDIELKDIPNFKLEYNLEGINYYDSKGNKITNYNLDREEVQKIKKFIDKQVK